ncbi:MAG: DUF5683 domain-containing protein [Ferruginibacter sp.]
MKKIVAFLFTFYFASFTFAQQKDSIVVKNDATIVATNGVTFSRDSIPKYNPNIAIKRSAILPGWGQATNKKYWKIPVVYGFLGTTAYLFFRNLRQYNEAKSAYLLATDNDPANDFQIKEPYFAVKDQPQRIRSFRNSVRQNIDYSALFFIVFWGLNVADAAVDAHLKTFDVNEDLSLQLKPGYSPLANTTGFSLVLNLKHNSR